MVSVLITTANKGLIVIVIGISRSLSRCKSDDFFMHGVPIVSDSGKEGK